MYGVLKVVIDSSEDVVVEKKSSQWEMIVISTCSIVDKFRPSALPRA
jgi:hypothetical protein